MFGEIDSDGIQVDEGHTPPPAVVSEPVEEAAAPAGGESVEEPPAPDPAKAAKPADDRPRDPSTGKFVEKAAEPAKSVARPGNPRRDPEARIAQALEKARLAEERAARAEERARLADEGRLTPLERKPAVAVDTDPAPKVEDYGEDWQRFVTDTAAHAARQEVKKVREASQRDHARTSTEQRHQEREAGYRQRIGAAVTADPEFLNKLSDDVGNLTPSHLLKPGERRTVWNAIADEVVDSEHAAQLLVHLSAHPDELQRLATLQPRDLTRQMAILGHKLATDAAPKTPAPAPVAQISQARPPVRPVESAPIVSDDPPGDDASDDEHYAYHSRQLLTARHGRR
jgi:hypothetical protein